VRSRWPYRIADTPSGLPFGQPARPRAAILGLIAVVVVAAVIGAFVGAGTGTGGSSHAGTGADPSRAGAASTAATSSATELGDELRGVLRPLAGVRTAGLARERSAGNAAEQATAIATIAGAYRTAAARVAVVPGSPVKLRELLADLASSYGALAAAARAANPTAYRQLAARIDLKEQQLRTQAASL
jgi:hypothetical protein